MTIKDIIGSIALLILLGGYAYLSYLVVKGKKK